MSKRYTVDETWELCLKMWKWISLCEGRGTKKGVGQLKQEWLAKTKIRVLQDNCFLCEKAMKESRRKKAGWFYPHCTDCPAKKIDEDFNCQNDSYSWDDNPRQFYAELKRLNKIRLGAK